MNGKKNLSCHKEFCLFAFLFLLLLCGCDKKSVSKKRNEGFRTLPELYEAVLSDSKNPQIDAIVFTQIADWMPLHKSILFHLNENKIMQDPYFLFEGGKTYKDSQYSFFAIGKSEMYHFVFLPELNTDEHRYRFILRKAPLPKELAEKTRDTARPLPSFSRTVEGAVSIPDIRDLLFVSGWDAKTGRYYTALMKYPWYKESLSTPSEGESALEDLWENCVKLCDQKEIWHEIPFFIKNSKIPFEYAKRVQERSQKKNWGFL